MIWYLLWIIILNLVVTFCYVRVNVVLDRNRSKGLNDTVRENSADILTGGQKQKTSGIIKVKKIIKTIFNNSYMKGFIRWKLRLLGMIPSHRFRLFFLKNLYGMKIGKNVVIYGWSELRSPWLISIGNGSIIGDDVKLDGRYGIEIGENVNFSTGVWIWTEQHNVNDPFFSGDRGAVKIDNRSWISCRVTILPGVHVAEGCVVAAGAVVTKDCEEYGIYGGVPSKRIAERNRDLKYSFSGEHLHFF